MKKHVFTKKDMDRFKKLPYFVVQTNTKTKKTKVVAHIYIK